MPWTKPNPPTTFNLKDNPGDVALFVLGGQHQQVNTRHGVKPAWRMTVVMLTGRHAGVVNDDVLLFGNAGSQFRDLPEGHVTLGRISVRDQGVAIDDPSTYDNQVAEQWMAANPGVLDRLRHEAVLNYRTQDVKVRTGLQSGNGGPAPAPSQQWTAPAPQAVPGGPTGQGGQPGAWEDVTPGQAQPGGQPPGGYTLGSMGPDAGQSFLGRESGPAPF